MKQLAARVCPPGQRQNVSTNPAPTTQMFLTCPTFGPSNSVGFNSGDAEPEVMGEAVEAPELGIEVREDSLDEDIMEVV